MTIVVRPTADDVAAIAADEIMRTAETAIEERGVFHWALSGGSTPGSIYEKLAANVGFRGLVPVVHLYWVDDRTVPPTHVDSNVRLAMETLIEPARFARDNVHSPISDAADLEAETLRYEEILRKRLPPSEKNVPMFDLITLGLGGDGHTASLFPGTKALHEKQRVWIANEVPQMKTTRLTLTFPALAAARKLAFIVTGAAKAGVVADILLPREQNPPFPAATAAQSNKNVMWFLDEAAAGQLVRGN
jgi:6-phosphogluconolactonase